MKLWLYVRKLLLSLTLVNGFSQVKQKMRHERFMTMKGGMVTKFDILVDIKVPQVIASLLGVGWKDKS